MAGRFARRVDANQRAVTAELRVLGYSVELTHTVGGGFPDLAVGRWGITCNVELKNPDKPPSQRKLTPAEREWHGAWKGCSMVAETAEEIDCFMRDLHNGNHEATRDMIVNRQVGA